MSHEPKTPSSQRGANGQFLLAFLSPRECQIRHVRADDEEHESNRREKAVERALQIAAAIHELLARRTHPKTEPAGPLAPIVAIVFVRGMIHDESPCDCFKHRFRLLNRDAWLEPGEQVNVRGFHPAGRQTKRLGGKPEFCSTPWKLEMMRHHSNDRELASAHFDGPSDDTRVAAKDRLPPGVTQHDDCVLCRLLILIERHRLVLRKGSTQQRPHVPERKEIRRNRVAIFLLNEIFGLPLQPDIIGPGEVGKEVLLRAHGFEHRRRHAEEVRLANVLAKRAYRVSAFGNLDEAVGGRSGQRIEQHRVDDAVNRRARPDAQRKREHGHGGEARVL